MHAVTMKNKVMNFNESEKGYMGVSGERKGQGEIM